MRHRMCALVTRSFSGVSAGSVDRQYFSGSDRRPATRSAATPRDAAALDRRCRLHVVRAPPQSGRCAARCSPVSSGSCERRCAAGPPASCLTLTGCACGCAEALQETTHAGIAFGGQRRHTRRPDHHRRGYAHHIVQPQVAQALTKGSLHPITGIGQNAMLGGPSSKQSFQLLDRDLRLGRKLRTSSGTPRSAPPGSVLGPLRRQIQSVGRRHAGDVGPGSGRSGCICSGC